MTFLFEKKAPVAMNVGPKCSDDYHARHRAAYKIWLHNVCREIAMTVKVERHI